MVEPLATDDLVFTYGSFDSSDFATWGVDLQSASECYGSSEDDEDEFFSIVMVVTLPTTTGNDTTDEQNFATLCANLEAALSQKKQAFQLKCAGTVLLNWDPTPASLKAFKQKARIQRTKSQFNTNWTAEYRFELACRRIAPSSVGFRRNGDALLSDPFVQRRIERVHSQWSASPGMTAQENYIAGADAYDASKLPTPVTGGAWQKTSDNYSSDEDDKEGVGERVYREHVNGQVEASIETATSMLGRRIATFRCDYIANGSTGATAALTADALTWWGAHKPTPVPSGEWVQVYETLIPNSDLDTEARAVFVFWEVVGGLRRYSFKVESDAAKRHTVTLQGSYMQTAANSATTNYANGISALRTSVLAIATGAYDSTRPNPASYDENELAETYDFMEVFREGIYPSGPSGTFDPNVGGDFTLAIISDQTGPPRLVSGTFDTRPFVGFRAIYSAAIDKDSVGGTDMATLWDNKFERHCLNALKSKLRARNVTVTRELLTLALEGNRLQALLEGVARMTSVTSCRMVEETIEEAGGELVPWADGVNFEAFDFDGDPEMFLHRQAEITYDPSVATPLPWKKDELASGFRFERTGDFEERLAARRAGTLTIPPGGGWVPIRRVKRYAPDSLGFSNLLNEVTLVYEEFWAFATKLMKAPSAPGKTRST